MLARGIASSSIPSDKRIIYCQQTPLGNNQKTHDKELSITLLVETEPTMVNLERYALATTLLLARTSSAFLSVTPVAASRTPSPSLQQHQLFNKLFSTSTTDSKYPIMADETIMSPKAYGTSDKPVQKNLRWKCDFEVGSYYAW